MATILVIDDDPHSVRLVNKVLAEQGHYILAAKNGLDGLKLAREVKPDLILLDLNLPDLDGRAVGVQLRGSAKLSNVLLIAFTADATDKTRRIVRALGYNGLITKPIDTRAFPSQITQFIEQGTANAVMTAPAASFATRH
jgi:two-component system, cell cycle response regulator DivK